MDLQFRNLRIRNAVASDAPQLTRWWNDGSVMAHAGFPHGLGTTEEEVAGKLAQDREETGRRLILELDGAPVGEMCYRIVEGNKAQIGIKICEAARQEQGYGRIALSLLIRALFDRGVSAVVLDTDLENRRAQHVYASLGFTRLGVRRDCWRNQIGELRSAVDYEIKPGQLVDFTKRGT